MKPRKLPNYIVGAIYLVIYLGAAQGSVHNLPIYRPDTAADIVRCPLYNQYFQKVLGYRPDFTLLGNKHDLLRTTTLPPNGNDINATAFDHELNVRHVRGNLGRRTDDAINVQCWLKCKDDIECSGYVLFLNVSQCYGLTHANTNSKFYTPLNSDRLVLDSNSVYFEKICLTNVPTNHRNKLWLFTKIPGSNLVFQGKKTLSILVSRARCAEQCLLETEFQCLSASFIASHKNNEVRLEQQNSLHDDNRDLGTCILSPKDKTTQPDAFRVSTNDEEYIENQCAVRSTEDDNCAYEVYPNSRLIYGELEIRDLTQTQCKDKCVAESRFFCQGISYAVLKNGSSRCLLHSEDVISLGPRSLVHDVGFVYERRVKCLNVSVVCTRTQMTITYTPYDWFNGRIYVSTHSDECSSQGKEDQTAVLRIPIGNELKERRCGILRAYQIEKESHTNRTLLSALVVIQMNPIVQTQGDRLVKVGCIIDNNMHDNGMIDDISLGSSLAFGQMEHPNEGSLVFNTTGTAPRVSLRIVDISENTQTSDVALGQNLEFQIHLSPPDSQYDIRAIQLIARSNTGHNSILLLDNRGCTTDPSVFPQLQKRTTETSRMLFGRFHAFKFAGSPYVNFEVVIQFCLNECQAPICGPNAKDIRRKRRSPVDDSVEIKYGEPISVIGGATQRVAPKMVYSHQAVDSHPQVLKNLTERNQIHVEAKEVVSQRVLGRIADEIVAADVSQTSRSGFNGNRRLLKQLEEVPLQFQLNVRSPDVTNSESLIYGENNNVLIAGRDDSVDDNFLCVNRTFVILMLVMWILLQTILISVCCIMVRKYKRMAELEDDQRSLQRMQQEFESRKVHWADHQGGSRVLMYTT